MYGKGGVLKYNTNCAPNNGYFLIPLYDKVSENLQNGNQQNNNMLFKTECFMDTTLKWLSVGQEWAARGRVCNSVTLKPVRIIESY